VRRAFQLPEEDLECLTALGIAWETVAEGAARCQCQRRKTVLEVR